VLAGALLGTDAVGLGWLYLGRGGTTMVRRLSPAVAAAILALALLGPAGSAGASATFTISACQLFTAKDFRAVFHRPPSAVRSEGHSKCAYFFDKGHQRALLLQVRHDRIAARFRPRHLYSRRKLASVESHVQRHLGSTTTPGESFIKKNHWGLIVALIAVTIAVVVIAEVIHRRRKRRRAVVAPVPRPTEPPQSYLSDSDKLTPEDYDEIYPRRREGR
jgi:hypothetical protein